MKEVGKCHLFPSEDVVHGMPFLEWFKLVTIPKARSFTSSSL